MPTTPTGVEDNNPAPQDAETAFLKRWQDAGMLSDGEEGAQADLQEDEGISSEDQEDGGDYEELDFDEADGEEGEEEEGGDDQQQVEAPDEALVTVKIGDETKKVAVKDLKRLYGQEAALTKKSQEVAQARKQAEEDGARYVTAAQRLLEDAHKRFEPYKEIDWLVASKTLTASELAALRQEATAAYESVKFLETEVNTVMEQAEQERRALTVEAAKECVKVLEETIPNWSPDRYKALRDFSVSRGMSTDVFNSIVDPVALSIINDALTLQEARARAATKKKAAASSNKVVKRTKGRAPATGIPAKKQSVIEAQRKLRATGSDEAAQNAFLARWEAMGDDD